MRTNALRSSSYRGPRATPTVSGDRVYTFSQVGHVHCIDAITGTKIWDATVSQGRPGWGYASSVLLEGDLAIVNAGYRGAAFNRWTGAYAWGDDLAASDQAGSASAKAITWNSQRVILLFTGHSLEGLNPTTGAQVFWYNRGSGTPYSCADPIVYGNTVFVSNGRNSWCARLNMVSNAMTHAWSGELSVLETRYNTAVLVGNYLYGFNHGGQFRCVDIRDASVKWSQTGYDIEKASLIASDGKLIVLNGNGHLYMIKATPDRHDAEDRSLFDTGLGTCWTTPALVDGLLYCRSYSGNIGCFRLQGAPTSNDGDTLPDTWEQQCFTNHTDALPDGDEDDDGCSNEGEYVAGTDPTNALSVPAVVITESNGTVYVSTPTVPLHGIGYDESLCRYYDLFCRSNMVDGSWMGIPTHTNVPGTGTAIEYTVPSGEACKYYRLRTRLH